MQIYNVMEIKYKKPNWTCPKFFIKPKSIKVTADIDPLVVMSVPTLIYALPY
jgi:hypothetical protein